VRSAIFAVEGRRVSCCDPLPPSSTCCEDSAGILNNLWRKETNRNKVVVPATQAPQPSGIGSKESILGLLKSLKIRAQVNII
jgi:hypothetical protein